MWFAGIKDKVEKDESLGLSLCFDYLFPNQPGIEIFPKLLIHTYWGIVFYRNYSPHSWKLYPPSAKWDFTRERDLERWDILFFSSLGISAYLEYIMERQHH